MDDASPSTDMASSNAFLAGAQRAWLLNVGAGCRVAVAMHEMSQISLSPPLFEIPQSPPYCRHVMGFQERILPVIDLAALMLKQPANTAAAHYRSGVIGVSVYQTAPGEPLQYAALHLEETPSSIIVRDDQACELPDNHPEWANFSFACFQLDKFHIPILNLAALFSEELRDYLNPESLND